MAETPLIVCADLVKIYSSISGRVQALRGVDLIVPRGAVVAVVGPSGSGKSSLLRIVAGLEDPSAGSVTIDGIDLARASRRSRRKLRSRLLSHVYQRPTDNLISHLTAREQIARVAVRRGAEPATADALLERIGLAARAEHRPHELSGGEQQRLAFARAAAGSPALVIADEPTAELDTVSSSLVLDTIDHLVELGVTVLIATHDAQVLGHVGQIVTLRDGAVGSVEDAGSVWSVVDRAGRLQLPPELRRRFPDHRATLVWDDDGQRLVARPPEPT